MRWDKMDREGMRREEETITLTKCCVDKDEETVLNLSMDPSGIDQPVVTLAISRATLLSSDFPGKETDLTQEQNIYIIIIIPIEWSPFWRFCPPASSE